MGDKCVPCTQNCNACTTNTDATCDAASCAAPSIRLASVPSLCKQCAANCVTCSDTAVA